MDVLVDARGLLCPLPLLRARAALADAGASDVVVVLATDREAPIDLAALAADVGRGCAVTSAGGEWRVELLPAEQ